MLKLTELISAMLSVLIAWRYTNGHSRLGHVFLGCIDFTIAIVLLIILFWISEFWLLVTVFWNQCWRDYLVPKSVCRLFPSAVHVVSQSFQLDMEWKNDLTAHAVGFPHTLNSSMHCDITYDRQMKDDSHGTWRHNYMQWLDVNCRSWTLYKFHIIPSAVHATMIKCSYC